MMFKPPLLLDAQATERPADLPEMVAGLHAWQPSLREGSRRGCVCQGSGRRPGVDRMPDLHIDRGALQFGLRVPLCRLGDSPNRAASNQTMASERTHR